MIPAPLISIIMPAYNAAAFIGQAIASVQAQSWQHWELLVVDDGSTDDTASLVEAMTTVDNRIRLSRQANGRQGKARNTAIANARGELLAFLDADDYWKPNRLHTQWEAMQATGADAVFSDAGILEDNEYRGELGALKGWLQFPAGLEAMLQYNQVPILTVLVKKKPLLDVEGFSEAPALQNAEDYHLWFRLLLKGYRFYGLNDSLAVYRRHGASATFDEEKVFWPACYALYDLSRAEGSYQEKISRGLRAKLTSWLTRHKMPEASSLQKYFQLYFASKGRAVPALFKLGLPAAIEVRTFKKWYA